MKKEKILKWTKAIAFLLIDWLFEIVCACLVLASFCWAYDRYEWYYEPLSDAFYAIILIKILSELKSYKD